VTSIRTFILPSMPVAMTSLPNRSWQRWSRRDCGVTSSGLIIFSKYQDMRELLGRYVSDATTKVVEPALSRGETAEPEVRDVSICFTDIRGFTAFSKELDPLTLFSSLNQHLSEQVDRVHEFQCYIDKFGGDGLMAVFDGDRHPIQSCLCALDILERALSFGATAPHRIRQLGIGIYTGRAIVGNIGSKERLEFTAIGTTVNLAARLCGVPTHVHCCFIRRAGCYP
jgi:adenylate cyclase